MRATGPLIAAFMLLATSLASAQDLPATGLRGQALNDMLRSHGITLMAPADQPVVIFDQNDVYDGQAIEAGRGGVVLLQQGGHPCEYTLELANPLASVSFNRSYLKAGPSGVTQPVWSVTAFDGSGRTLSSVGEAEIRSYSDVPARRFTLTGPGIRRLVVWGDDKAFDGFCNVVIDSIDLIHPG
jgi:hypothetical protein